MRNMHRVKEKGVYLKKTENMKRLAIVLFLIAGVIEAFAGIYVVKVKQTQLYNEPDANSKVVVNVQYGTQVKILKESGDWSMVQIGKKQKGWIWTKYVEEAPEWKKLKLKTGNAPHKYAVKPIYDKNIDNYLNLSTSKGTEAIVKLMKMSEETVTFADTCVRIAYIASNSTYTMKNIPLGRYYIKVAYGREYSKTTIDGEEYEGFRYYPLFELMQSTYEFKVSREIQEDGSVIESISSYQASLSLEVAEEDDNNAESVYENHNLITESVFEK